MPDRSPSTAHALENMLNAQFDLELGMGHDLLEINGEERATFVRDTVLACCHELHEALDEIGWKPWATSRHFNRQAYLEELIDAFHFLMSLWLTAQGTTEEWQRMYFEKWRENRRRQQDGYTGVKDA